MDTIRIFLRSYGTYLSTLFEYRPAFVTDMLANIISYSAIFIALWLLMDKFKLIQGWDVYEILLMYNLHMVSYAICSFFFYRPMLMDMEDMIRTGRFDIVLIRPMNALLYTILGRPTIAHFGHLLLGTVVLIICFSNLDIEWTLLKVLFLVLTLVGAALFQGAMYLIGATLGFWIVRPSNIFGIFMWDLRSFINYPISIYARFIQVILTFVVPFAFINYYPAHYLLAKDTANLFHPALQFGTPVVGIIFILLAYKFWTIGVNKYESTGS